MILIGYSGHAYVAISILQKMGKEVSGYCDNIEKDFNPFNLPYLGSEQDPSVSEKIRDNSFFISIGDNKIRRKIAHSFKASKKYPATIIHPSLLTHDTVEISTKGVMISAGVVINPFASIGEGSILNTSCVIEHECVIGTFAHIGPGTVLCGNVTVGENTFVGAGSVVKENIRIGKNTLIGAGSVIIRDVPDNVCVVGNPGKIIKSKK